MTPQSSEAELSRLLFLAREQIDMWGDVVARQIGHRDPDIDGIRDQIDAYRISRGWSQYGYGGERADRPIPPEVRRHFESMREESNRLRVRLWFALGGCLVLLIALAWVAVWITQP